MLFSQLNPVKIYAEIKSWFTGKKEEEKAKDNRQKINAQRLINYYGGDQKDYLAKGFGFTDPDTGQWIISPETRNITKKIIDKVSMVYKYPPERTLVDKTKGEELEKEGKVYQQWVSHVEVFDNYISEAERQKNLHGKVLWRNHFNVAQKKWRFLVEYDYKAHFLAGYPLEPIGFSVPVVLNQIETEYQVTGSDQIYLFFSDALYFYYNTKGKSWTHYFDDYGVRVETNGINPYGVSPFVEVRKSVPIYSYDMNGALDLISANEAVNVNINNINMAILFQAFGIVWDNTGLKKEDIRQIVVGANKHVHLPQGTTLNNLDLNPKIPDMIEWIKTEIETIAWTYNMTVNWHKEATPVSGFSLIVQNQDYIEQRQKDVDEATKQEKQIFRSIRAQQNYHKADLDKDEPKLPLEAKLNVDFQELDLPINQTEEIAVKEFEYKYNISSPIDEILSKNPDMDRERAEKKLQENKKDNGRLGIGDQIRERIATLGGQVNE